MTMLQSVGLHSLLDENLNHSGASVVDFPAKTGQDAGRIQRMLEGDVDSEDLLKLLCRRSYQQRIEIVREFQKLFNKELGTEVCNLMPKDTELRRLLHFLVTPYDESLARELRDALRDAKNVNTRALVGIIGTHKWRDLQKVRATYERMHGRNLLQDLNRVKQPLRSGLLHILQDDVENRPVMTSKARKHADFLTQTTLERGNETTKVFMQAACKYGLSHMRAVELSRSRVSSESIGHAATRLVGGPEGMLIATRFQVALDEVGYYAETLHNVCQGMSTDHNVVIRILASRCSIDMVDIKTAFKSRFHQSLDQWIRGGTVGVYQDGLIRLIKGNRSEVAKLSEGDTGKRGGVDD